MGINIQDLEKKILKLPINERAQLIKKVLQSLDDIEEGNIDAEWEQEINKRYELYKQGKISKKPIKQVLEDARANLQ